MPTESESHYEEDPAVRPLPGALLVFSGGAPQLRTVAMTTGNAVQFSRDDVGGAALPDQRVSNPHCELTFDGRQFTVSDLNSRNGTWLDGEQVMPGTPRMASNGSVLRIAGSIFLLCGDVRRFQAGTVTTGERVIGPAYRAVIDQVMQSARGGASVLVVGENGTGKELLARMFHEAATKSGPFVAINCAAIPQSLAESQLFGTVKGSYTEAKDTLGHIRTAHNGTLFLDELGELDLKVQAKLLRVVEQKEVQPVGASTYVPVEVRFISATNRDLAAAMEAKEFREDLYFRLAHSVVRLPALRDRKEEIPWLIAHALAELPASPEGEMTAHPSLVEKAMLRDWPGNVRELIAQIRKAGTQAKAGRAGEATPTSVVRDKHLDTVVRSTGQHPAIVLGKPNNETLPARPSVMPAGKHSKEQVLAALEANGFVIAATQRALGIPNRTTLVRLITKYELKRPGGEEVEADEADNPAKE